MLTITVPGEEYFDEEKQEFFYGNDVSLSLEHSLISISKWESTWKQAFLGDKPKTDEMLLDYIKCMTLNKAVDESVYFRLSPENLDTIKNYLTDPHTASHVNHPPTNKKNSRQTDTMTSELIYYWMTAFQIPWAAEKWHINRLLTLIDICNVKNNEGSKNTKVPKRDIYQRNRALNQKRRAALHSKG